MLNKTRLSVAVSASLGLSASMLAPLANAQKVALLEEIVVTGSRILKTNLVSPSPVVQVDAEELGYQGTVRVEDMLSTLPQIWTKQNTAQSNGATGTATINLRNLGDERTLVLINGRRMPAGSPIGGGAGADINQIPGALVKNVEILTGGNSAVYGSDAVAGVVNFNMVSDFEGVKLDYQYSGYQHDNSNNGMQKLLADKGFDIPSGETSDGETTELSFIIGGNFGSGKGKGNVTAYATYRDVKTLKQSERDYSACALNGAGTVCGGSGTIPEGRVTDFGSFDYKVAGTEFVPRVGTVYNYGPENYFQRPDERYTFGAFAHYDISDRAEVYSELMFTDDRTVSQIAPSGAFFITDTLPCGNPLLSEQQFDALCGKFGLTKDDTQTAYLGRRNVEGGRRQQDLRHTTFRGVFGARGQINDAWRYDVYAQYSEVSMENTYLNDLSITKIKRALDAVTHPETGETVCRSVEDGSDPNCVLWNIFTTGAVTQEMLDYLVLPLFARGTTDQTVYSGYLAVDLGEYGVQLPAADSGVDLVFGAEYREENLDFSPDSGFISGDGAGQGGATPPVSGGYDVTEFFLEASLPLVQGKNYAQDVTMDLAYRYSDYSTDQQTDTYGIAGAWAVNDVVKLRASYQRAVRAANVREIFQPQGFNLFDMDADPCGGATPERSQAECARTGVTAERYGSVPNSPAGQYNYLQGGNPDLAPEEADTYSYGVVLTIPWVDGFNLSIDYFDIQVEQGINNLTPEFILNQCLDGNEAQCASVRRGNAGDLWIGSDVNNSGRIKALEDNLSTEEVKGWDVTADLVWDIGAYGSLAFNNVMSIIDTWDQTELEGAPAEDCKGNWGSVCGYPTPDFRNSLRTVWTTPWDITVTGLWRHVDEVQDLNGNLDIDKQDYFDLAATWEVAEWATLRSGVNNIFDEEPPIAGAAAGPSIEGTGNVFPGLYDHLGRYWYFGVSVGF